MSGVRALEIGVYTEAYDWLESEDRRQALDALAEVAELGRTLTTVPLEATGAERAPGERA